MMFLSKKWYRSKKFYFITFIIALVSLMYLSLHNNLEKELDLIVTRRVGANIDALNVSTTITLLVPTTSMAKEALKPQHKFNRELIIKYVESKLQEALKSDKGTGCEIPRLDPFAKEVMQFDEKLPKIVCTSHDWVKCYMSECRVTEDTHKLIEDIRCSYSDIVYHSDNSYTVGPAVEVRGDGVYTLAGSDHVKIKCTGKKLTSVFPLKWTGTAVGFRTTVERTRAPAGRESTWNVVILGFDSTSHNGFIRKMPNSYKVVTEEMHATVLNGYNIVGDGTPAALFPILTGKSELELPDVRRSEGNRATLDNFPFLFYRLKDDGYRTAYFEDMPWIGTFQYRFNGFKHQPADHYLRDFYQEYWAKGANWWNKRKQQYCVGDTPQYKLMLNLTEQFLKLDGKRFIFTFIADITHDDANMISTSDEDVAQFLRDFHGSDRRKDTLLILMGDHGPRFAKVRSTLQGKLEERLPLMVISLPESLRNNRPAAATALLSNADALTTPFDIHTTILDAIDLKDARNTYKVGGSDLMRGLSLLEPIPRSRSCSEAGIEAHWCVCLRWENVTAADQIYQKTADALLHYLNTLTHPVRDKCVPRTLSHVEWVMRQHANKQLLSFVAARDQDGYLGNFGANSSVDRQTYQIKMVVGPGVGVYEASLTYLIKSQTFNVDGRDISRTNEYGNEPHCISSTHPHLNMFCYCKQQVQSGT